MKALLLMLLCCVGCGGQLDGEKKPESLADLQKEVAAIQKQSRDNGENLEKSVEQMGRLLKVVESIEKDIDKLGTSATSAAARTKKVNCTCCGAECLCCEHCLCGVQSKTSSQLDPRPTIFVYECDGVVCRRVESLRAAWQARGEAMPYRLVFDVTKPQDVSYAVPCLHWSGRGKAWTFPLSVSRKITLEEVQRAWEDYR